MQTALNNNKAMSNEKSAILASEAEAGILSREKTQAVQQLIKLTRNLADLAERESPHFIVRTSL